MNIDFDNILNQLKEYDAESKKIHDEYEEKIRVITETLVGKYLLFCTKDGLSFVLGEICEVVVKDSLGIYLDNQTIRVKKDSYSGLTSIHIGSCSSYTSFSDLSLYGSILTKEEKERICNKFSSVADDVLNYRTV